MSLFTIRLLRPEDAQAVFELHTRAIQEVCAQHYTPAAIIAWVNGRTPEGYLRNQTHGENLTVAVDITNTPLGFCGWKNTELCGLYVNPNHHGKGIGSLLVAHAEATAKQAGTPLTHLESTITAQSFYEKHGYIKISNGIRLRNGIEIPHINMKKAAL